MIHTPMLTVFPIPAFADNYIWSVMIDGKAIVVDPGDAAPVLAFLQQHDVQLAAILITHWHGDHTGGIEALRKAHPDVVVYGPEHKAIAADIIVADKDQITLCGLDFSVVHIPGHTLEHIAFYLKDHHSLFCGDTLFAGGCGRVFEGTAQQMLDSLTRIANLPDNTAIYCAHEYTISNLRFALQVEPQNLALQARYKECVALREQNLPTLPSLLGVERNTNPFLRVREPDVIDCALSKGATSTDAVAIFACIREWKNNS